LNGIDIEILIRRSFCKSLTVIDRGEEGRTCPGISNWIGRVVRIRWISSI
jgi:hypothetical protein